MADHSKHVEAAQASDGDPIEAVTMDEITLVSREETDEVVVVDVVADGGGDAAEWVFDLRDGLADDIAQAANEMSAGQFRPGFLIPVLLAAIGAAYVGIWIGDRILPFGRTTVGKATGAALGTLLADVISRKVRQ